MTLQVSNTDMHEFARIVWTLAGSDSAEAQAAMAWVIVNRMMVSGVRSGPKNGPERFGDGSLVAACKSVLTEQKARKEQPCLREAGFGNIEFCRAFAVVCRVWNGDLADPTSGAVDFHNHKQNPGWSRDRNPSALIGRHFYYP